MKTPRILAFVLVLLLVTAAVRAQTWDGGEANDFLITAANWNPDAVPSTTADVIFGGVVRLTPNVSGPFQVNSLTFNNTAGAFVFGGAGTLSIKAGGLVNNDATLQTFNNPVSFGLAATSMINAASGALTLDGAVTLPTTTLTLSGANAVTFGGAISGAGAITKSGAGAFNFAATATAINADFNLNAGTTTLVATGVTQTLGSTSTVAVNGTGIFNVNESMTFDGAQLTRATGATLGIAAGKTLTLQNGGDALIAGDFVNNAASTVAVIGAGSTFTTTGLIVFRNGSTTNVLAGGRVSSTGQLIQIGDSGTGTVVTVDGGGSGLAGGTLTVGVNTTGSSLTFNHGSTGAFGTMSVASGSTSSPVSGTLTIQGGAAVTGMSLDVAFGGNAYTGTVTITGAGSALTLAGAAGITAKIGGGGASVGALNVQSGGTFDNGNATTVINASSTVAVAGGTFNAGDMIVPGQLTRDATGIFNLSAGKTLTVQSGGDAMFTGAFSNTTASTIVVTGAGSTFSATSALGLGGGSTTNVLAGGNVSGAQIGVGINGNGTVTVDGVGSSLGIVGLGSGTLNIGGAATGIVTFSNGSTGSFSSLAVDSSLAAGTTGALNIQGGAGVTATSLALADLVAATTGAVTVTGTNSTLTLSGNTTIGASSLSTGTLSVLSGGAVTSGTGTTTVNPTGTIAINGGTYTSNGSLILNGGQFTANGVGAFSLAPGTTLTVQSGGDAVIAGDFLQTLRSNLTVTGSGSTFTTGGNFQWEGGNNTLSVLSVRNGGSLTSGNALHLARNDTAVFLSVTGAGSQISAAPFSTSEWLAGVSLTTGATANLGRLRLADVSSGTNINASFQVVSGSTATLGDFAAAAQDFPANATITVDGVGSQITQTGAATLTLGAAFSSSAALSIGNGGAFTSGTGAVTLNATGTINVNGGTLNLNGPITDNGGAVNFTSGALNIVSPLTIGTGGLLGDGDVSLPANRRLSTAAATTINAFATLTLAGGTLRTAGLTNDGAIAFNSGTLAITGASGFNVGVGALGPNVALGAGANLEVTNTTTVAAGALLAWTGVGSPGRESRMTGRSIIATAHSRLPARSSTMPPAGCSSADSPRPRAPSITSGASPCRMAWATSAARARSPTTA